MVSHAAAAELVARDAASLLGCPCVDEYWIEMVKKKAQGREGAGGEGEREKTRKGEEMRGERLA